MYSRKSVGPRIEPWGNPVLTGYSGEDFPSRTTRSRLLMRKEEIRTEALRTYKYFKEGYFNFFLSPYERNMKSLCQLLDREEK